ncbi:unnamed protein product [Paramecium primaurelia]|uniref:peptidylprolyl isomerase n=2 Tax=Paramecium TaxID=5884 RepID=A0A8S1U889_9CILI|nr:unnamed protein product [Paramecium primaurelia]CAD8159689.1 unnamed protein product [Paramecium pentaurelia]
MLTDSSLFYSFSKQTAVKVQLVFLDIKIGTDKPKRVIIKLFYDEMPKTCENFRALCTGEKSNPYVKLNFRDVPFHKIYSNFMALGGDILNKDGTGQCSIYGPTFKAEPKRFKHDQRGLISMFNDGNGNIGSQFFFTFTDCSWVDGLHSVFGKIVEDYSILDELEKISSTNGAPKKLVRIVDSGVIM